MKKIYSPAHMLQRKLFTLLFIFTCLLSSVATAQFRKLGFVYSENMKGGAVMFGNTLMYYANPDLSVNVTAMNGNSANGNSVYDNGNYGATNMQYVDVDGSTGEGAATRNSSSADLILPSGTNTIKFARLYWGGRALGSEFNLMDIANQKIKIRKGSSGAYTDYAAAQIDRSIFAAGTVEEYSRYQAFTDITDLVKQEGAGTYMVGNGAFSTGTGGDFGNYGAWCIVVVYENPALNYNSVRVIDGFQEVYTGGGLTSNPIILTGLNIPTQGLSAEDAQIGVANWEGDARWNGDYFKVNEITLSNGINQSNNPWNGTISINGQHVTTKNPNYTDQMGIDIDQFNVGTGFNILPDDSTVSLRFGTTQDQYFVGVVTAVVKMTESEIKITKAVKDASNNQIAEAGEVLTYTIKGKNYSAGNVSAVIVSDSLPSTMNFVANSLKVNYCPGIAAGVQTDTQGDDIAEYATANKTIYFRLGNGANGTTGGSLASADSFEIEFKVTFSPVANGTAPPVINVARVRAKSATLENYIDDATVVISGATAQHITYTFTGNGNWDNPANWSGNKVPPATLPVFSSIIIDHIDGGQCVLNVSQNIATGASIIVNAGKSFVIPGNLRIL